MVNVLGLEKTHDKCVYPNCLFVIVISMIFNNKESAKVSGSNIALKTP